MNLVNLELKNLESLFHTFLTDKTSNALSVMLDEPIEYRLQIFQSLSDMIHNFTSISDTTQMCSVRLNGQGDVHIELLYALKITDAKRIASKLLNARILEINHMGISALQEVANILTGSFFNALSENTGFKVDLSTPSFMSGKIQDLLRAPVDSIVSVPKNMVIADSIMHGQKSGAEIHMIIIQHSGHARKLLTRSQNKTDSSNPNLIGCENNDINSILEEFSTQQSKNANHC